MQVYKSITELPIWNYHEVTTTGMLKHLISDGSDIPTKKGKNAAIELLNKSWESIEDEIITMQLEDPTFVSKLKEDAEHYLLMVENLLHKNALNSILWKEAKTQHDKEKDIKPFDFAGSLIYLSKFLGYRFDPKVGTVSEYFKALQIMTT